MLYIIFSMLGYMFIGLGIILISSLLCFGYSYSLYNGLIPQQNVSFAAHFGGFMAAIIWVILKTKHENKMNYNSINPKKSFLEKIKSKLEKANFKKLTELEVQEQTQWIVYSIQKLIKKNQNAKNLKYSDRWGIYHNGVEVTPVESFTLPISSDIKLALGLTADWNEIEIFYETSDDYVFFSWFTGA